MKKTTLKARVSKTPALTDPHLVALLSYINGGTHDDADDTPTADEFSRAHAAAHVLLASLPLTSAFAYIYGRPTLYEQVAANVAAEAEARPGTRNVATIRAAQYGGESPLGDHDMVDITRSELQYLACGLTEHGALVGACLMYQMLKGGAR